MRSPFGLWAQPGVTGVMPWVGIAGGAAGDGAAGDGATGDVGALVDVGALGVAGMDCCGAGTGVDAAPLFCALWSPCPPHSPSGLSAICRVSARVMPAQSR